MSEYLVLLLVQVTIFSSVTAVLLLAVKWIFRRRIPPMLSLLLWLILLVRVTLPMLPESALSIYNLIPAGREITFTLTHEYEQADRESDVTDGENPYQFQRNGNTQSDGTEKNAFSKNGEQVVSLQSVVQWKYRFCVVVLSVFLAGVVCTGCLQGILYDRAIHRVYRSSFPCDDPRLLQIYTKTAAGLRIMDKKAPPLRLGSTTMLAGLLQPCVILHLEPTEREPSESELRLIFLHELQHFKYRDNWILLLSTVVCVIFWYNPLLWLVRHMLREDIEVLCDARTLERSGNRAGEYARMLCRSCCLLEPEAGTAMSASGRKLKRRLQLISDRRKGMFLPRVISGFLCAVMIAVCLTNPMVSADSVYAPYIERVSEMTGRSVRELTLQEQVTTGAFLEQCAEILTYADGERLAGKIGGGSLMELAVLSEASPWVSAELADALAALSPEEDLTVENCSVILAALTGILGEGRYTEEVSPLPEMLSADTMESLCRNLTKEDAAAVKACYNLGVDGADVSFSRVYTKAMMDLIRSRIRDNWFREKLTVYYQKVNLSAENLDEINAYLEGTVRYVGVGKDFYICDPALSRYEEDTVRSILGAAWAGEREDVYYRKQTEDGCSFAEAAAVLASCGMTWRDAIDEYALLGETIYTSVSADSFIRENGSLWISAWQAEEYLRLLSDEALAAQFAELFSYHETYTYTDSDGSEDAVAFRYYTAEGKNAAAGRALLEQIADRLSAPVFLRQYDLEEVPLHDTVSEAAEEACLLAANLGYLHFGKGSVSGIQQITNGRCARILCRFLASMDNAY